MKPHNIAGKIAEMGKARRAKTEKEGLLSCKGELRTLLTSVTLSNGGQLKCLKTDAEAALFLLDRWVTERNCMKQLRITEPSSGFTIPYWNCPIPWIHF